MTMTTSARLCQFTRKQIACFIVFIFICAIAVIVNKLSLNCCHSSSLTKRFPVAQDCENTFNEHDATRTQLNALSQMLNELQQRHQRLICETKRQYDISETGGWCRNASGLQSKYHYTDNRLAAALANFLNNKSVIGLGDGQGHYRRLLLSTGKVTKYDAFDGAPDINNITKGKVNFLDLTLPQYWLPMYDWAVTIEVLEHIPAAYEHIALDNVVRVAREGIVLSWAVPGQYGYFHVNNQPQQHVDEVMAVRNFQRDVTASNQLRNAARFKVLRRNMNVYRRV